MEVSQRISSLADLAADAEPRWQIGVERYFYNKKKSNATNAIDFAHRLMVTEAV